jgi:hypothetical protein
MRVLSLTFALVALSLPALGASAEATPRDTAPAVVRAAHSAEHAPAIRWQKSLTAANALAVRTGKPLFLLHLFGKLDEQFC